MIHNQPSPLAGKIVHLVATATHPQYGDIGGRPIEIEDWVDRVNDGVSWKDTNNWATAIYAARVIQSSLPHDDEALYGKLGHMGVIVHVSEIASEA